MSQYKELNFKQRSQNAVILRQHCQTKLYLKDKLYRLCFIVIIYFICQALNVYTEIPRNLQPQTKNICKFTPMFMQDTRMEICDYSYNKYISRTFERFFLNGTSKNVMWRGAGGKSCDCDRQILKTFKRILLNDRNNTVFNTCKWVHGKSKITNLRYYQ